MGYYNDTTVEVEYNGKVTRVAKEDAHIYEKLNSASSKPKKAKEPKEEKE
jgi:hypothetical protein